MRANSGQAWYVSRSGRAEGPFATEYVRALLSEGHLTGLDLVYREGDDQWLPAAHFSSLSRSGPVASDQTPSQGSRGGDQQAESAATPLVSWIVLKPHGGTYLQDGPYSTKQVIDGLRRGRFQYTQYIWRPGIEKWCRIGDLAEFDRRSEPSELVLPIPPPLPDPVAAVILEDDDDEQAEEFHISIPESTGEHFIGSFSPAPALVPPQPEAASSEHLRASDLAAVPWEKSVELGEVALAKLDQSIVHNPKSSGLIESKSEIKATSLSLKPVIAEQQPLELPTSSRTKRVISIDSLKSAAKGLTAAGLGIAAALALHFYLKGELTKSFQRVSSATGLGTPPQDEGLSDESATLNSGGNASRTQSEGEMQSTQSGDGAVSKTSSSAMGQSDPFHLQGEFGSEGAIRVVLQRPQGYRVQSLAFSGAVLINEKVRSLELEFSGRAGQLVDRMQLKKSVSIPLGSSADRGQIQKAQSSPVEMKIAPLGLPDGFYDVVIRANDSDQELTFELYLGDDPNQTAEAIEEFIRINSAEVQSQKRTLFYAARDLDQLARELARIYGQTRKNKGQWASSTTEWLRSLDGIKQALKTLKAKPTEYQAFPEQVDSVIRYAKSLEVVFDEFSEAVKQSRDIASDRLSDLIAALGAEKQSVGSLSVALKNSEE